MSKFSRRVLLTRTGALIFGLTLPFQIKAQEIEHDNLEKRPENSSQSVYRNAYIQIEPDNNITFMLPNIEIGQGINTAAAMLLAEELEVDITQVTIKTFLSDAAQSVDLQNTITLGSGSVAKDWLPLRKAAAALKMMMLQAAAQKFGITIDQCRAEHGKIYGVENNSISYGELLAIVVTLPVPTEISLKSKKDYQFIGKSQHRVDTDAKITGKALYGGDIQLPNMKIGFIVSSSMPSDKIISIDDRETRKVKGVIDVLQSSNAVCIITDHYWSALQGAKCLVLQWESQKKSNFNTQLVYKKLKNSLTQEGKILYHNNQASIKESLQQTHKQYEWFYQQPILLHAALEPINCLINYQNKQCEIWIGSQAPLQVKEMIAERYHLNKENIIIHYNVIGGSFGRRLSQDYILQAIHFAQQITYPLKCMWSREADFQCDTLRPASQDYIKVGVDAQGMIKGIHHKVTSLSNSNQKNNVVMPDYLLGLSTMPYEIENYQLECNECQCSELAFGIGQGIEATRNVFVIENLMNRLAFHAQKDPIEYRRTLQLDDRANKVINLLTQNAEWGKRLPKGIRQGFAMAHVFGSYIALVIEAEITATSIIRLHRVVAAVDCGIVINPDQVKAQIESGIIFGLGEALYGEVQIEQGQVAQRNYNQYRVLRMNEVPDIKVHLIANDALPSGVGELGTVVAAPALAHALGLIQGKFFDVLPLAKQINSIH